MYNNDGDSMSKSLEEQVVSLLLKHNYKISSAESLTGGLFASRIVNVSGSSNVFDEAVVTYSNQSKIERLGVLDHTLNTYGAVSEKCAKEMVLGVFRNTNAEVCVSCTGIAGPSGGSMLKPVGLTYIGLKIKDELIIHKEIFTGSRTDIRNKVVDKILCLIIDKLLLHK